MTAEQAAHQMETPNDEVSSAWLTDRAIRAAELVTEFLHDDNDDRKTEPAVGHDGSYYARPDGSCMYCEARHPKESPLSQGLDVHPVEGAA